MIRRPPRSTLSSSSAASDVYKRQPLVGDQSVGGERAGQQPDRLLDLTQPTLTQSPLVQRKAPQKVISQRLGRPDAKLRAALRVDAVANREDGVEVEVFDLVGLAVRGSCCSFCNNCSSLQFPG